MRLLKTSVHLFLALSCLVCWLGAQTPEGGPAPQTPQSLTSSQWREDLDYLVKRLEIMHPNLYANISREKFEAAVAGLRSRSGKCSDSDMTIAVIELLARVKDGHTRAIPVSNKAGLAPSSFGIYPLRVYAFSDGLFVLSATKQYEALVGKKIVKVGKLPVAEAMLLIGRLVSADNPQGILGTLPRFFFIREVLEYLQIKDKAPLLALTVEDATGSRSALAIEPLPLMTVMQKLFTPGFPKAGTELPTMDGKSSEPMPLWLQRQGENYWFTWLAAEKSMYLQINAMAHKKDENFAAFCSRLFDEIDKQKPERLIIDLRHNGGGDHIEMPLLKGIIERPAIDRRGSLFLLTSRTTFSAAQHVTTLLTRYTNVTIMGESTSGKPNHFGNTSTFNLPHSGISITTSKVFHQDSQPEDFSTATEPDFFVPLSAADFAARRDPVLERLFDLKNHNDLRPLFLEKMTNAYTAGGLENLKQTYREVKPEYARFGFNLKGLLYDDLDPWMAGHKKDDNDYIAFLRFLRDELPGSSTVCWDLASWMGKSGDREEQVELYRECLRLNPAHRQARMAIELEELEQSAQPKNKR